jgi:hypothetical protein
VTPEARGLALVLRQAAATYLVQDSKIDLPVRVSLIRGELKEAGGFALVLRQAAPGQVADSEIVLPVRVSLIRGELKEAGGFALVLRHVAATDRVEKPEADLRRPIETKSPPAVALTIGTVFVTFAAATRASPATATITFTFCSIKFPAINGNWSSLPSAYRYSRATVLPSS